MNLYEINQAILDLVDTETGEILDYEAFAELKMAREEKIEGMALWHKNLTAEAAAIRAEEINLAERRKVLEKKADRLKQYLTEILSGDKFSTARVACSFRKSKSVEIQDEAGFIQAMEASMCPDYLKYSAPTINRTAITNAIKSGVDVPGAKLIEKLNLSIK